MIVGTKHFRWNDLCVSSTECDNGHDSWKFCKDSFIEKLLTKEFGVDNFDDADDVTLSKYLKWDLLKNGTKLRNDSREFIKHRFE